MVRKEEDMIVTIPSKCKANSLDAITLVKILKLFASQSQPVEMLKYLDEKTPEEFVSFYLEGFKYHFSKDTVEKFWDMCFPETTDTMRKDVCPGRLDKNFQCLLENGKHNIDTPLQECEDCFKHTLMINTDFLK